MAVGRSFGHVVSPLSTAVKVKILIAGQHKTAAAFHFCVRPPAQYSTRAENAGKTPAAGGRLLHAPPQICDFLPAIIKNSRQIPLSGAAGIKKAAKSI